MHRVGFEPTSVATSHLECDALDRSAICAQCYYVFINYFIQLLYFKFI
jgi:hypothetical protein